MQGRGGLPGCGSIEGGAFSTHILSDVERVCDELAVLNEGKIVRTMDEVWRMCRSAAFVLEMERSRDAALLLEKFLFLQAQGRHGLLLKDAERLSELLHFIADREIAVMRIERQEATLEDLFMEVIGK